MSVESKGISKKNIKVSYPKQGNGNIVTEININFGKNRTTTIFINPDLLLRIEYRGKRITKKLKNLQNEILTNFLFFNSKNSVMLRKILMTDREIKEKLNIEKKELKTRDAESDFDDFLRNLKQRGDEIKKLQTKLSLDLISEQKEYYCKKCKAFRPGPSLSARKRKKEKVKCQLCSNLLKTKNIKHLKKDIAEYLNGLWLEDYVAMILNSLEWKAWSSPHLMVYGSSGAKHQIDVLAVKDGRILIAECKTGEFNTKQIRDLLAKYYDIRCHHAIAVTTQPIHPEAKKLIEKNPAITCCEGLNLKKIKKEMSTI